MSHPHSPPQNYSVYLTPEEVRLQLLSPHLCALSPLLSGDFETSPLGVHLASLLSRLAVCPEDVLRLLAGARLLHLGEDPRRAEHVLGLATGSLGALRREEQGELGRELVGRA